MTPRRAATTAALSLLALLELAPRAARADCALDPAPPTATLHHYDVIFEGRVVARALGEPRRSWYSRQYAAVELTSFEVLRVWRGELEPHVDVHTERIQDGDFKYTRLGERWLVYAAREDDGALWDSPCSTRGAPLETHAESLARLLGPAREPSAAAPPLAPGARGCAVSETPRPTRPGVTLALVILLAAWRRRAGASRPAPPRASTVGAALLCALVLALAGCSATPARRGASAPDDRRHPARASTRCAPTPDAPRVLIPYYADRAWGFADQAGHPVIAPRYDEVTPFSGGLARVRLGRWWGAIDRAGVLRVPARWRALGAASSSGLMWARAAWHHVEVLDVCGRGVLPGPYVAIDELGDAIVAERVRAQGAGEPLREWALLDHRGEPLLAWGRAPIWRDGPALLRAPQPEAPWSLQVHDLAGRHLFDWRGDLRFSEGGALTIARDREGGVHLLDRSGHEVDALRGVTDLHLPDPGRADRVWAGRADGWVLLDLSRAPPAPLLEVPGLTVRQGVTAEEAERAEAEPGSEWASVAGQRWLIDIDGRVVLKLLEATRNPTTPGCAAQSWGRERGELVTYDAEGEPLERVPEAFRVDHRWALLGELSRLTVRDVCSPGGRELLAREWDDVTTCAGSHVAIGARDDQHYVVDLRDGARVGTIGPSHRVFCRRFPARAGRAARGYFEVSYSEGHLGGSFGVWAHDGRPLAPMQFGWSEPRELDGVELIALPYFGATLYVGLDGVRYFEGLPTPGRYPELAERELAEAELRPLSTAALEERWLELLARHGYLVPEARRAEFLAQDWYRPTWDKRAAEPSASALSPIERANYERLERALASRRR